MSQTPRTWTSSSLLSNSDTSTFCPSDTLVSETHSRPEARTCASEGRSRFRPDFNTLTRLKLGWRGPRFLFLASFATSITSSQHWAKRMRKKKEFEALQTKTFSSVNLWLNQYSLRSQWPTVTCARSSDDWTYAEVNAASCWSIHLSTDISPFHCLFTEEKAKGRLWHTVHSQETVLLWSSGAMYITRILIYL